MPKAPAILKPPTLWQADPQWANMKLGHSERTIKSDGCMFIAHLALYRLALGREVTAQELDAELKARGKYEGQWRNFLRPWTSLKGTFDNAVRWHGSCKEDPPPLTQGEHYALVDWLQRDLNNFAFIKLDFNRAIAGNQNHFVLGYGVDGRGDVLVMDPAFGLSGTLRATGGQTYYGRRKTEVFYIPEGATYPTDRFAIWRYDLCAIQGDYAIKTDKDQGEN